MLCAPAPSTQFCLCVSLPLCLAAFANLQTFWIAIPPRQILARRSNLCHSSYSIDSRRTLQLCIPAFSSSLLANFLPLLILRVGAPNSFSALVPYHSSESMRHLVLLSLYVIVLYSDILEQVLAMSFFDVTVTANARLYTSVFLGDDLGRTGKGANRFVPTVPVV
ncbi:uncharacterized protein SCHCODRAFT_02633907, partial [Schizophyllum commune H4-8]|uniref:uncharacterized protein n=1 Tax=Schizophyllum commune (strain H4-8 / FGSC 9210) TaxID=578458 RepID=UPI00215EA192